VTNAAHDHVENRPKPRGLGVVDDATAVQVALFDEPEIRVDLRVGAVGPGPRRANLAPSQRKLA